MSCQSWCCNTVALQILKMHLLIPKSWSLFQNEGPPPEWGADCCPYLSCGSSSLGAHCILSSIPKALIQGNSWILWLAHLYWVRFIPVGLRKNCIQGKEKNSNSKGKRLDFWQRYRSGASAAWQHSYSSVLVILQGECGCLGPWDGRDCTPCWWTFCLPFPGPLQPLFLADFPKLFFSLLDCLSFSFLLTSFFLDKHHSKLTAPEMSKYGSKARHNQSGDPPFQGCG
jgi:hypothetical protein